jgi:hypothetical protein
MFASPMATGSSGNVAMTAQVATASAPINASAMWDDDGATRTGGGQCIRA